MYEWFAKDRNRIVFLLVIFSPIISFLSGTLLLTLDIFTNWAYWTLFQHSILVSLYAFLYTLPGYLILSSIFLIAATIRLFRKQQSKYYWWLGIVTAIISLLVALGLMILNS